MKKTVLLAVIIGSVCFAGCRETTETEGMYELEPEPRVEETEINVRTTEEPAGELYGEELQADFNRRMDQINQQLDDLQARIDGQEGQEGQVSQDTQVRLEDFERQREELRTRWEDVRLRADETWTNVQPELEALREDADALWDEIRAEATIEPEAGTGTS